MNTYKGRTDFRFAGIYGGLTIPGTNTPWADTHSKLLPQRDVRLIPGIYTPWAETHSKYPQRGVLPIPGTHAPSGGHLRKTPSEANRALHQVSEAIATILEPLIERSAGK